MNGKKSRKKRRKGSAEERVKRKAWKEGGADELKKKRGKSCALPPPY
jgi:hypothetical protein